MLDGPRLRAVRAIVKMLSAVIGLPLATLSVMALVGLAVEPIWAQLLIAGVVLIGVPLFVADRLLPNETEGPAAEAAKGLVGDVLTVTWMVTATLVLGIGIGVTQEALTDEAKRLADAGYTSTADALHWLAGGPGS